MSLKLVKSHLPSKRQKAVLDYVEQFLSKHERFPTRREIAEGLGLSSPATIQEHMEALQKKGFLLQEAPPISSLQNFKSSKKDSSPLSTTASTSDVIELPVLGRVAAGFPIEAIETRNHTLAVPSSIIGRGEHYILQVSGQSMIEDGIHEGDFVVIKKELSARNGQTVVALIDNEATIKKYYKKQSQIELHPANPAFPVIKVKHDCDFKIEGILVSLIRKY